MKVSKEIVRPVESVIDIVCDCCGKSCMPMKYLGVNNINDLYPGDKTDNAYTPKEDAELIAEFLTIKGRWGR